MDAFIILYSKRTKGNYQTKSTSDCRKNFLSESLSSFFYSLRSLTYQCL